jgi:5-oxoprolinase (ATP-hydrolysing) subunit A
MKAIDLNCDLGEGIGIAKFGGDAAIFPLISSANIACGFHAGDPQVMRDSVSLALRHGVSIGAHPGTHDFEGFGRRAMNLTKVELENLLLYQIGALDAFARSAGGQIRHIKPHGWVYNEAAINANFAQVIARTVKSLNPEWILFGAAGSQLIAAAKAARLSFAEEIFADRTYQGDGSLTSRSQPGSLITDPVQATRQCLDIVLKGKLRTASGAEISLHADTICIHGDNPAVLPILNCLREELSRNGFQIHPPVGI